MEWYLQKLEYIFFSNLIRVTQASFQSFITGSNGNSLVNK